MDQNNSATPDELQQAINSITNSSSSAATDAVSSVADKVAASVEAATPAPAAAPAPAAPAEATAPVVPEGKAVYGDPDLDRVKTMALSDLRPILESVDIEPEKKFKIYKEIIEITEDKACIEPAYNAAKGIGDDKLRAESLIFIVDAIDELGIPAEADKKD